MNSISRPRVEALLERIRAIRALVVGDLMLDRYINGAVERISPEAPVPVIRVDEEFSAVGGAGNVAANIVALGAKSRIVGIVGADPGGEDLRRVLETLGARTEGIVEVPGRPTTVKTRVLARRQQIVRVDREEDADLTPAEEAAVIRAIDEAMDDVDVVVLEDYNKGVLTDGIIAAARAAALHRNLPIVVDPKRKRFFDYGGVTLFKPNAKELSEALGTPLRPDDPEWMESARSRVGARHLLLTLGEGGMALWTEDGVHLRVPALARSVYDVSGAGDTVISVAAVALAAGATPAEAALLANHAAAIEVGKLGVTTVSPAEILDHCRRWEEGEIPSS